MAESKQPQESTQQNEGEGNRTAAREFNEAQRRFVESGKVDKAAREAEQALDTPEKRAMERAEAVGKSHKRAEDPEITRKP
jgi:septation ring formation regulator EzrA